MRRSSGIPRGRAFGAITKIISARSDAKTVKRPTESIGSLGETKETTGEHTEHLWLFSPDENRVQSVAGERLTGDLAALAVADGSTDVKPDDRITHGGVEYEVDTVVGQPNDEDTNYWTISLIRRQ